MKAKMKIRALRALAIAGSLSAFAVPAVATARPATDVPNSPVRHENAGGQPYQLPSGFHSEVQTQSRPVAERSFNLPAGFRPEVQSPGSPTSASAPTAVIREIRTITEDGNRTLAIVLAAIALAVALCGTAYAWVRLTRMQRDLIAS
jgi:hypothetical protein